MGVTGGSSLIAGKKVLMEPLFVGIRLRSGGSGGIRPFDMLPTLLATPFPCRIRGRKKGQISKKV